MNDETQKCRKMFYRIFLILMSILLLAVFFVNICTLDFVRLGPCSLFDFSPSEITTQDGLERAYARALKDAEIAEPAEISRKLIPIVYHNTDLKWRGRSGESDILVVTWVVADKYDDTVVRRKAESDIWVTVVPELKNFCRKLNLSSRNLTLRLNQLLGLPPKEKRKNLVEIWVDPSNLFRPSPDPEISDQEAELVFPESGKFLTIHRHHVSWFQKTEAEIYSNKKVLWTRLGYTYDWGNPKSEIGLSEFVIRKGASIRIHSITSIDAYCN